MILLWLALFYTTSVLYVEKCQCLEAGFCSQKCLGTVQLRNGTLEMGNETSLLPSKCSCSPSCSVYGDCCFDSKHRSTDRNPSAKEMCLSLLNKGKYRILAGCSLNWSGSSVFCAESVGHLPPATSKTSGVTYANIHCAICNNDAEQLKIWDVHLKCCNEHDHQAERYFLYRKGNLLSAVPGLSRRCNCKFFPNHPNNSFTDALELRVCKPRVEISECSTSWTDQSIRKLCDSFQDLTFSQDKVYRNIYCAQCNYENLELLRCHPPVVERMLSEGSTYTEIFDYCVENSLHDCLFFFTQIVPWEMGRGRSYSFSRLMKINVYECLPRNGRRCCEGERYDFRSKRCRKIN